MNMDWKIYYEDESTFSSADGAPHRAPSSGFVCAVGYDETGQRYIMHGWDFYRWDKDTNQWWGHDLFGIFDRLRNNMPIYAYKEGRTLSKTKYQRIMHAAHTDPMFPQERLL